MKENDYRKRFYDQYITTQWQFGEKISSESFKITGLTFKKYITPFLPEDKDASILDIACGPGHLLYFLQDQGYRKAEGIDLGAEQLEIARRMGVKNIQQTDSFDYLKNYENEFDVIIALATIEHFTKEEALQILDLIYNALKVKGKIIISTSNVLSLFNLECTFGDFTHELVFSPRRLAQLLRVCKFSDVRVYGMGPVVYDLRSAIRAFLWSCLKAVLKACALVTVGTGRSIWKSKPIFESMILGIGQK